MKKLLYIIPAILLFASCTVPSIPYVDFMDTDGLDQSLFNVTSTKVSDIEQELSSQQDTKTTAISAANVVQKLIEYGSGKKVLEIVGTYESFDHNNNPITLSGKVIIPLGVKADRYILVSHYTIASDAEAPSNIFPLEGVLASMGYIMVFPDYEGYGVTVSHTHPYLVMEQSAYNVIDMMIAVRRLLANTQYAPEHNDIYLMGYSQGGATTMAVQSYIESQHAPFSIRGVFAGGGPYDIKATYQTYIDSNRCGYPFALPIVLKGMIVGNNLDIDFDKLLQPRIAQNYAEWYESKKYTTAQVNGFIGTHVASEILSDLGMDQNSDEIAELYKAMTLNSVTSLNWTPRAPVYMFHSIDDDTVPYVNAVKARERWKNANIKINFGHYGSHTSGAVRFIFTVRTFLKTAKWEEENNKEE